MQQYEFIRDNCKPIFGDSPAKWYDSARRIYFDGHGTHIPDHIAAMTSADAQDDIAELIEKRRKEVEAEHDEAHKQAEINAALEARTGARLDETKDAVASAMGFDEAVDMIDKLESGGASEEEFREALSVFHVKVLGKIVKAAGREPASGPGATDANLDALVELRKQT